MFGKMIEKILSHCDDIVPKTWKERPEHTTLQSLTIDRKHQLLPNARKWLKWTQHTILYGTKRFSLVYSELHGAMDQILNIRRGKHIRFPSPPALKDYK